MRLADYLEHQGSTDLDAFITRLDDSEERVRQNLIQFVVGDKVKDRLDAMLAEVGQRLQDNRDVGRFIYGSFGSGKSHLMTVLGKMLERDEAVYDLGHPHLRTLRDAHGWIDRQKTLVVRLNMMGKKSLTTALYAAYNDALPPGSEPLVFTDEERIFDLLDQDADRFGGMDALLEKATADGAIPAPGFYHAMRHGTQEQRLKLAADLLSWRNHGKAPVRPEDLWLDSKPGFDRIARHAKELGYDAIAWLIDELVIWIREKDRATYIKQVNDLSSLVDHDHARVLPFFVMVAVQMDIAETCPEDISEQGFREQLGFISNRFQPSLHLEDQDLFEVASQRVLARRRDLSPADRDAFEAEVDRTLAKHGPAIRALSGNLEPALVRRLYPFHPALLRVLVDVTQALSRQRTAIAALYGLLHRYPDLAVGDFVPLGALWDVLFTQDHVQSLRQNARSTLAQRLADTAETWRRLEGKAAAVAEDEGATPAELAQLVRSALLCQLSERPYFPDGRALKEHVTASTLLRLNQSDVRAVTERTGVSKVARLFIKLNGVAPQVQWTGDRSDPTLHVRIEQVDIEKVLAAARAHVDHQTRFAYMRRLLIEQFALDLGNVNEGPLTVLWRGTRRRGTVRLCNVRTLSYAGKLNEFDPGRNEFLVLVDYPFDEDPGRTRDDDITTAQRARARTGQWTVAWLPAHLSPAELTALDNAAAVELVRRDERRYLDDLGPAQAREVKRALEGYQQGRKLELEDALRRAYLEEGVVQPLRSVLDGIGVGGQDRSRAVQALASAILEKRYPNHPAFTRRIGAAELSTVADLVIRAAKTGQPVELRAADEALVTAVAQPMELVYLGKGSITPRTDGRYLRPIMEWVGDRRELEAKELRGRLMDEAGWSFGLTRDVADFFIYYLLFVGGYEARVSGRSATIHGLNQVMDDFRLVKDEVVSAPEWDNARALSLSLLGLKGRQDLPTSPEQAKLSRDVAVAAQALSASLDAYASGLRAACAAAEVPPDTSKRLASAVALRTFLQTILAEVSNADRVRRLGGLATDPRRAEFEALRKSLSSELEALGTIAAQKLAVEHVGRNGTEAQRTEVVTRLQNLLTDPVSITLASKVEGWAQRTTDVFAELLAASRVAPPPPVVHPVIPDPTPPTGAGGETWTSEPSERQAAHAAAMAALENLLPESADGRFRVTISVERLP